WTSAVSWAAGATLTAPSDRISDQAIAADQNGYAATQGRIKALNDGMGSMPGGGMHGGKHRGMHSQSVPVADYYLSKAQCWLDVSFHEYTRNDRSAFAQGALTESVKIISALETNTTPNPGDQTPQVNGAAKLRPDLWLKLGQLKQHSGFGCAAQKVACGEVELVHAGNEYNQQGWRHAKPYIQIAEDMTSQGSSSAERCHAPEAPQPPMMPVAQPPVMTTEQVRLDAGALFRFDRSGKDDMLPEGRAKLDELARKLSQGYARIERMTITGYTDRLGTERYNQALSERRAQAVANYLKERGVTGSMSVHGRGKADQVVACGTKTKRTPALVSCLQPNRRVEIQIEGVKR
ncbi:OmpA family protein, partial [Chitinimonas sp. BJB300]|uniref:OmpA family protein n=2 Tax=Chitinimonas sp. BJB300 TaxID=1559339 RepID=UPI000C0E7F06